LDYNQDPLFNLDALGPNRRLGCVITIGLFALTLSPVAVYLLVR
jgi:hypothetical protein